VLAINAYCNNFWGLSACQAPDLARLPLKSQFHCTLVSLSPFVVWTGEHVSHRAKHKTLQQPKEIYQGMIMKDYKMAPSPSLVFPSF
jgi:hypothetical protein